MNESDEWRSVIYTFFKKQYVILYQNYKLQIIYYEYLKIPFI